MRWTAAAKGIHEALTRLQSQLRRFRLDQRNGIEAVNRRVHPPEQTHECVGNNA